MSQPLQNPICTNNPFPAYAQIAAAGRRVTAMNWNRPGWKKDRYVSLFEIFHTANTDTLTLDQGRDELNAPK